MLVLSRKQGEQIQVGESVQITVVSVSGNRVRLGIQAPNDVRVLRGELEVDLANVERANEEPQRN